MATQTLPPASTTVTFPGVQPGTYTVSLVAAYSEGASLPAVSAPVTLAAPKAKTKPRVVGPNVVGYRIACKNGGWAWPGAASFTVQWLRDGTPAPGPDEPDLQGQIGGRRSEDLLPHHAARHHGLGRVRDELVLDRRRSPEARAGAEDHRRGPRRLDAAVHGRHLEAHGQLTRSLVWRRDGTIIKGATRAKHTVEQADAGHQITCKVSVKVGPQTAWYRTASILIR